MTRPVLSVVIPVYNRAEPVARAVASVIASVAHADLGDDRIEIVVVDDGSSDGSAASARAAAAGAGARVDLRVVAQPNAGPAAARNLGVRRTRAPFVAFLDSDDVWFDWTLAACLRALEAHPEAVLVFLNSLAFVDVAQLDPGFADVASFDVYAGFLAAVQDRSAVLGTGNAVIRRAVFDRLGGFDPQFRCYEDTDLFFRADPEGSCVIVRGDPLMGRQRGREDSLIDDWRGAHDGARKMQRKEDAGLYPGGAGADPDRTARIARTTIGATRLCFANGRWREAYGLVFANGGPMLRGGLWPTALRLALTPLLALVRPKSYRFRLRPAAGR